MRGWSAPVVLGIAAAAPSASADEIHELRHDVALDATVAVTATILVVGSELGKGHLAADPCRWCETNALDDATRDALRWKSASAAHQLSNVTGFGLAPLDAFGTLALASLDEHAGKKAAVDALLLYEAFAVSAVVTQVVKLAVGRERPFVHALSADEKEKRGKGSDDNLSFYSGHTGLTMTLAAAGGTIATLRGYRLAPLVWSSGAAISAFTGYLRIAADRHWLTDVLAGAAIGATVGILVPLLLHGRRADDTTVTTPAPAGSPPVASFGGTF